jgi:predicted extracellular nuclease
VDVQNLFPAGSADGPNTLNDCDDKLNALAGTVQALAPDVLALQEIGNTACLQDLLVASAAPGTRQIWRGRGARE